MAGSGIYWMLSSLLIGSFTALAPGVLQQMGLGTFGLFVFGGVCTCLGVVGLQHDLTRLYLLFSRAKDGWVYTLPLILVGVDIYATLIGLSTGTVRELNPFVSAAVQSGPNLMLPFIISYMALSQGTGLVMLGVGNRFYGQVKQSRLPFCLVCGVASFGPASNVAFLALGPSMTILCYFLGVLGSVFTARSAFSLLRP